MAPYLQLDLNSVTIDVQLAQKVPYALSRYYMVLPLGQDNGYVSVAMAYPENVQARQILSRLLQAEVVPVFTPAESLQPVLERIHCPQNGESQGILAWYGEPRWKTAVMAAATMLGATFQAEVTALNASELDLDEVLATTGAYELAVLPLPVSLPVSAVLHQAATAVFFVRGEARVGRNILMVMRGFASDEQALHRLAPFAWRHQATVTLMPLAHRSGLGLSQYHHRESPAGQHLDRCLRRLHRNGVPVNLKFRQGDAVQQVVEEVTGDSYDLLVLAAEAEGDFVSQVITAVDQHHAHCGRPIFILKPRRCCTGQPVHLSE